MNRRNLGPACLWKESASKAPERPKEERVKERPADGKRKFRRGRLMLETCGSSMSNMNPSTCNLPNLQTVCAQRFPNTVVKIVLHLD